MSNSDVTVDRPGTAYRMIWRWHFYAGLICVPFVIWLALTGSIYLWRPQIEAWLDRPYNQIAVQGTPATPGAQVAMALAAVPGSTLHRYMLPQDAASATRILVTRDGEDQRVIVDPYANKVMTVEREEGRPMRLLFHLHGELLAGAIGSYIVEIAACWTIVMLLTGLYLWWPRGAFRFAGTLAPRLRAGSSILWRDLHATAGIWVSVFALILILTGLPWAKGWGSYLAEIRSLTGTSRGAVDWTIGGKPPKQDAMTGDHMGHMEGMGHMGMGHMSGMRMPAPPLVPGELARVIATAQTLDIAPPVLLNPPSRAGAPWRVTSDAADRPLRSDATIDGASGRVLSTTGFGQRHWIDRVVGYGVAVHEGALFGLANQIVGSLTALLLVVLATTGTIMWWRRRPAGVLGAPAFQGRRPMGAAIVAAILVLALYMPMFGVTLLAIVVVEATILRRIVWTRTWLGLAALPDRRVIFRRLCDRDRQAPVAGRPNGVSRHVTEIPSAEKSIAVE